MAISFKKVLKSDKFIITAEICPVKGTSVQKMIDNIEILKDKVDALNVTDNQSAVMRYPSLGTCLKSRKKERSDVCHSVIRNNIIPPMIF